MYDNPKKAKVIVGQVFFKNFLLSIIISKSNMYIYYKKKLIIDFNKLLTK
jgi:hypothetical protein